MTIPTKTQLGVIGGSGVYKMSEATIIKEHQVKTPFGAPSSPVVEVELSGKRVFFLPRHGMHHEFTPSEVNYRANVFAMKTLGITHLLAVSAVGIMNEDIKPGDLVVPDQLFDRTKGERASTFFGQGIVGHVSFADPFSAEMRALILAAGAKTPHRVVDGGAYVCMEGPQFSTRAESRYYRKTLDPAVIGMTALPEAKLAREAELCYGLLALGTDYDCWHESQEDVSVEAVLKVLRENTQRAHDVVQALALLMPETSTSPDLESCKYAIVTQREAIPESRKKELAPLYGKYLS